MDKEKIPIQKDLNEAELIKIKKNGRLKKERAKEEIDEALKDFYKVKKDNIERPVILPKKFFIQVAVFSIIFGLIAGFFSALFLLTQERLKIPFSKEIELRKYFPVKEVNLVTEKKVTVLPDERVSSIANNLRETVVDIFLKKRSKKKSFLSSVYLKNEALGVGFVLTTDGWIVTLRSVVNDLNADYVVLTQENNIYNVKKVIVDPITEIVFLKIDADNLKVVNLSPEEQNIGETILLFDKLDNLKLVHLSNLKFNRKEKEDDFVYSTEKFPYVYKIDSKLNLNFIGSPAFSLDRNVIGIVNSDSTLIPVYQFKEIIDQVLSSTEINRPYLGIDYLDLSEVFGMIESRYKDFNYGALVYGPPIKNSPAEKADIKNADLIIKIDNIRIDSQHNLTEVIQSYRSGDKIEITLLRNHKEKKVDLILGIK